MPKPSSSILLISTLPKYLRNPSTHNYNLLLLKRLERSRSFPNKYVFPGGVLDQSDKNKKWSQHLSKFYPTSQFNTIKSKGNIELFKMLDDSSLMPEIAFRICAIRELYEETGLLLAKDENGDSFFSNSELYEKSLKEDWSMNISKDSDLFLEICQKYSLTPDIFALYEYCDWLSPSFIQRRFLTVFFMAFLNFKATLAINKHEADSGFWKSPTDCLVEYSGSLAPPQIAELFYLSQIKNWENLLEIGKYRQTKGGIRNRVIVGVFEDGKALIMSGDSRFQNDELDKDFRPLKLADIENDKYKRRGIMKPEGGWHKLECNFDLDRLVGC